MAKANDCILHVLCVCQIIHLQVVTVPRSSQLKDLEQLTLYHVHTLGKYLWNNHCDEIFDLKQ